MIQGASPHLRTYEVKWSSSYHNLGEDLQVSLLKENGQDQAEEEHPPKYKEQILFCNV